MVSKELEAKNLKWRARIVRALLEQWRNNFIKELRIRIVPIAVVAYADQIPDSLRAQLADQVLFIVAGRWIVRKKADDRCIRANKTHRAVPQSQISLGHGVKAAGRHLQHLQSSLLRPSEKRR